MLKADCEDNNTYNGNNWANQIKTLLQDLGMNYIWTNQIEMEIPYTAIRQWVFDTYMHGIQI